MEQGFLHIYTGNGKGKSTAAFGLALRAAGAGKKILLAQFLKSPDCSEHRAFDLFKDSIEYHCFGTGEFVKMTRRSGQAAGIVKEGIDAVSKMILLKHFDLIILDEIIVALSFGFISIEELLQFISKRPAGSDMVLTGRGAPQCLIDVADVATEMVEVKHYFHKGITARKGIEM